MHDLKLITHNSDDESDKLKYYGENLVFLYKLGQGGFAEVDCYFNI